MTNELQFNIPCATKQVDTIISMPGALTTLEQTADGLKIIVKDKTGEHEGYLRNGEKGDTGTGIENVVLNPDYTLTITMTDGTSYTTASIRGENGVGISNITMNDDYTLTITMEDGTSYVTEPVRGEKGDDGISPTAEIEQTEDGAVITITDKTGTTTAEIKNGEKGDDGVSPEAKVEATEDGAKITITDKDGTTVTVVNNGEDGNGIKSAVLNPDYTLTLTFTDGTSYTTPSIRGEKGEGSDITTNNDKIIKSITRNSNGSYVRVLIETNDGSYFNVVGLPERPTDGSYLRSAGISQTNAVWEEVGAVESGNTHLVTGGAVYQAIQDALSGIAIAEDSTF